jgi:hypothetical protein
MIPQWLYDFMGTTTWTWLFTSGAICWAGIIILLAVICYFAFFVDGEI